MTDKTDKVSGATTQVEVWEEFIDGVSIGFVSRYAPLDLISQGNTREEAVAAMRDMLVLWAKVTAERLTPTLEPDRNWRTGVHLAEWLSCADCRGRVMRYGTVTAVRCPKHRRTP